MTIHADEEPLLKAATYTAENDDISEALSTQLGRQFERVKRLFDIGGQRTSIELPEPVGRSNYPDDETDADSGDDLSGRPKSDPELLEWSITVRPICDVRTEEGSVWYIYPMFRSEVEFNDFGCEEVDGVVAIMMAREDQADIIDRGTAVELLQVYIDNETEDGEKTFYSPDLGDYAFTDQEIVARYSGLITAIEADIAARN
jgi:hypothetical protein